MKLLPLLLLLGTATAACAQQARPDLYRCEGCEAVYELPFDGLDWHTTIPPEGEPGEPLVLTGTVYLPDGVTPASGIVLYAYHTNAAGVYPAAEGATGWARRHGYLRGWVKTDAEGRYRFHTIRPASYPDRTEAAHIHLTVKEPDHTEYWIDSVVFEDDPLVDDTFRRRQQGRGGSGVIALTRTADGVWHGSRGIVLERHPN